MEETAKSVNADAEEKQGLRRRTNWHLVLWKMQKNLQRRKKNAQCHRRKTRKVWRSGNQTMKVF